MTVYIIIIIVEYNQCKYCELLEEKIRSTGPPIKLHIWFGRWLTSGHIWFGR